VSDKLLAEERKKKNNNKNNKNNNKKRSKHNMSPKLRLGDIIRKQTVLYFVTFLKHSIKLGILNKMKAYALTGNSINWFNSYLKGRKQQVVIKIILQHIVKYV
jgi:hypothetical protein